MIFNINSTRGHTGSLLVYTIILLKFACLSLFAVYRSQFLLDRLRRYFKLFISTVIPSPLAFASEFGLAHFL